MPQQHYALRGVTDPHPVRPGTSAALTARTIDATIHPPIVRAQEAVAEVIPRIAAPLSSPLFVGTIALTLLLGWAAIRNRLHVRGFLVSAVLVLMLTSFRPMTDAGSGTGDAGSVTNTGPSSRFPLPSSRLPPPQPADPPDVPDVPDVPELRTYQYTFDTHTLPEEFQQMGLPPEVSVEITMPERIALDREILRAQLRELRIRIREEKRRQRHQHQHRYYHD